MAQSLRNTCGQDNQTVALQWDVHRSKGSPGGCACAEPRLGNQGRLLEEVTPKLKCQGEAGGSQVMMGKGRVQSEQHMLKPRGKSEQNVFKK